MYKYLLFGNDQYYPAGEMRDFIGAFETPEEARNFVKTFERLACNKDKTEYLDYQRSFSRYIECYISQFYYLYDAEAIMRGEEPKDIFEE